MSRRSRGDRRATGVRVEGRRPAKRAPFIAIAIAVTIVVIAGVWIARRRPAAVDSGAFVAVPDSIARLGSFPSYQRALALGEQQRFTASLAYFRHALEVPPDDWHPYDAFAVTLFHATLESRRVHGRSVPSARSSYERVSMMRESARALERGERLARSAGDQSIVIAARAQQLAAWGFSWDALSQYARAELGNPKEHARAVALTTRMRNPLAETPAIGDAP